MILLTEPAAKYILEQLGEEKYIRVSVQGGGCHGFKYCIGPTNSVEETDIVSQQFGVDVVMDQDSANILDEAVMKLDGSGFLKKLSIQNPKAKSSCGCGESFS